MGIQVTETKSLNTGAELSEFYVGLRKNQQYHMNIQISPDSNTYTCLLYTSPSPRDLSTSRMPSSA